ncbi:MAG TPA: universal stress protein [Candidatus Bathyarchaeia archaeon]|nr:universal stress protein [Candidatus Bathyarchaeia archaeon]
MATAQLAPARVSIRNVLIATDFSHCSNPALHFGLQLSKAYGATAYIVFVLPNDPYLLAGPEAYVAARDAARRDLEDLEAQVKRAHGELEHDNYHLYLLEGDVAQSILDFAHQQQADLIVLGTHGRGGLPKALLGSVAERVFRHAPVPVLTLGPRASHAQRDRPPRTILVAADFTPASRRAVRFAAELAREHRSNLTLLHVLDPKPLQDMADPAAVEQGIKTRLAELLGCEADGVHCSIRVAVGRVTKRILEIAREEAADLLVLGVRPSGGVLDRLVIPYAYEIVRDSPCPVLTLRETKP